MKYVRITIALAILGIIASVLGIQFFDITLFEEKSIQTKLKEQPSPQIEIKRKTDTTIPGEIIRTDKLTLSQLMGMLEKEYLSSNKLETIEEYIDRMPESLSLRELNSILDLFYLSHNKLKVVRIFQSRLEVNYPASEFERFQDQFYLSSNRKKARDLLLDRRK